MSEEMKRKFRLFDKKNDNECQNFVHQLATKDQEIEELKYQLRVVHLTLLLLTSIIDKVKE